MIVTCYSLDLTCDGPHEPSEGYPTEFPWQYTGKTHIDCIRKAAEDGWIIYDDKLCFCPECVTNKVECLQKESS